MRASRCIWLWLVSGCLAGCTAIQELPEGKCDILSPEAALSRSVIVLPDPHLEDFRLADFLKTAVETQCQQLGFQLKDSEAQAELVIIPTIVVNGEAAPSEIQMRQPAKRRPLIRYRVGDPGEIQGAGVFGPLGGLGGMENTPAHTEAQAAFIISAIRREDWLNPEFIDAPMPKVWRISIKISAPLEKLEEAFPRLLDAARGQLEKMAKPGCVALSEPGPTR